MSKRQPNILFISSDQHRRNSAGCYGNRDVITPAMDRMAREGVRFTECLTAAPLCAPTRSTWQTGLNMHQHGCHEGGIENLGRFKGMADYLNEAGYQTCFIGKSHWHKEHEESGFVPPGQRMGWQEWYGTPPHDFYKTRLHNDDGSVKETFEGQYEPPLQTEWAMRFIGKQSDAQPWCVNLNFGLPHSVYGIDEYHDRPAIWKRIREVNREYGFNIPEKWIRDESQQNPHITCPQHLMFRVVPQEFLDMYDRDRLTLDPDVEEKWEKLARYYYQEYYAMISALDREIGRLMAYLESSGRLENTIVIYTSDHGDLLCSKNALRAKATSYQNALRVPLLVWGPRAGVAQGLSSDALTSSVDLLPTVLGFAGIESPPNLPGKNMAPWALGKQGPVHDAIFAGLFNWRAVYDGDYLYTIKSAKEPSSWIPVRLTDVKRDPLDQVNLVESPDHAWVTKVLLLRANLQFADSAD